MEYKPGDIVNGHILGTDNQWHPVPAAPQGQQVWHDSQSSVAIPPRKRKVWPWVVGGLGGLLGLFIIISIIGVLASGGSKPGATAPAAQAGGASSRAAGSGSSVPSPSPTSIPPAAAPESKVPGLNEPVRDGDFEFVVTKVDCSKTKIGDQYLNQTAQGKYCLVSMKVTNIGKEAHAFLGGNQKALDGAGRIFEPDAAAMLYLKDAKSLFEKINPGNSVNGTIAFDVPKDVNLVELKLHDSMFSGGVTVKVG